MEILRRNIKRAINFFVKDEIFYPLYITLILVFTWLNWNNQTMSGILPYYYDFKAYIESGFSSNYDFIKKNPTFPMWGYGFVLYLCSNKMIIVFSQLSLMVYNIIKWDQYIFKKYQSRTIFRIFVLLGFSLILFNIPIWPYSFSSNFIALSLLLLLKINDEFSWWKLILAGILQGIALNLRSDYFYFLFLLSIFLLLLYFLSKTKIKPIATFIFFGISLLILVPWMLHTHKFTGKYIPTSTNGGHVLYIGLGQLPNNVWGITPDDNDPKMVSLVNNKLGTRNTLDAKADSLLKLEFRTEIFAHPNSYIQKCLFSLYLTISRPFSLGEIESKFTKIESNDSVKLLIKNDIINLDLKNLVVNILNGKYSIFIIPIFLNFINIFLYLFMISYIVYGLFRCKANLDFNLIIVLVVIFYQFCLQTFTFYNPNYHTNIYLFYILAVVMFNSHLEIRKLEKFASEA